MDIQYLLLLQNLRELSGHIFDAFFIEITTYSEALLAFMLLGLIYWCVDKRTGTWMAFNVAISCTWNQVVKNICRIDRPWVRDERIKPVEEAIAAAIPDLLQISFCRCLLLSYIRSCFRWQNVKERKQLLKRRIEEGDFYDGK